MNGKTIRTHLVNGLPSEILTAEIINWTGKIIVAPRSMLAELAKREEVKRTGVYTAYLVQIQRIPLVTRSTLARVTTSSSD